MIAEYLIRVPIGLLPVLIFLLLLTLLDSYKLVMFKTLLLTIAGGTLAAASSFLVNTALLELLRVELATLTQFIAPITEELLKASVVIYLFRTNRIGFLVDGAIVGFSVGAGFALAENIYYLYYAADAHIAVWIVRGFGTAIMHGGVTAIFAVITQTLTERSTRTHPLFYASGLFVAIVLHALFNQLHVSPIVSSTIIVITLPCIMYAIFKTSATRLHEWLAVDFDRNEDLLLQIHRGEYVDSRAGKFLLDIREHFDGLVAADILCYIRLYVELSLRAQGRLMAREFDIEIPVEEDVADKLAELHALKSSIGKTAMLVIKPYLNQSRRELPQIFAMGNQ